MWNKRKEDEYTPRPAPAPAPPASVESAKEGIAMSPVPGRTPAVEPRGEPAAIGKSVIVKGQIYSREDLYVDGELEGTVELQEHKLTVGPNGKLQANVKAREVVVLGSVQGNIDAADRIDIRKDAKLIGDIKTTRIIIEDGAYFKGSIDITRPEAAKAAAAQARPQQATAASAGHTPPIVSTVPEAKR